MADTSNEVDWRTQVLLEQHPEFKEYIMLSVMSNRLQDRGKNFNDLFPPDSKEVLYEVFVEKYCKIVGESLEEFEKTHAQVGCPLRTQVSKETKGFVRNKRVIIDHDILTKVWDKGKLRLSEVSDDLALKHIEFISNALLNENSVASLSDAFDLELPEEDEKNGAREEKKNGVREDKKNGDREDDMRLSQEAKDDHHDVNKRVDYFLSGVGLGTADFTDVRPFTLKESTGNESEEEETVYPLSKKYSRTKAIIKAIVRYIWLFLFISVLVLFLVLSHVTRHLPVRIGYFADKITLKTIAMEGTTEFSINPKNCLLYLLENTDSQNEIELYVSAPRSTKVDTPSEGEVQFINIEAETDDVGCYVELKIPGGVSIPKLSINYDGDKVDDLILADHKDGSSWSQPMIIDELSINIKESYPSIFFINPHRIESLSVKGDYCVGSFHDMKIASMALDVTLGSISIIQNSEYSVNKVDVRTPHGTHCIAGGTVTKLEPGESVCPDQSTKDEGFTGDYVDTTQYCISQLFVCSSDAGSCPAATETVSAGQGNFKLKLDDGPIQFLISGGSTEASVTYNPTYDQFAISSQIQLLENKNDFSSQAEDPRIYLYETVSPGYAKMWTHSSLKQYIQARPWLISLLSLNLLSPSYYRNTLIHIPSGSCPYLKEDSVRTNTLISEKIKALSFVESNHLVSLKESDTYYKFILTAENDFKRQTISFMGDNWLIIGSLIITIFIAVFCVGAVFYYAFKIVSWFEILYRDDLEQSRKFARTKKVNRGNKTSHSMSKVIEDNMSVGRKQKVLVVGIFTSSLKDRDNLQVDKPSRGLSKQMNTKRKSNLSFFKAIYLIFDFQRRKTTNSLKLFIDHIYKDFAYFTELKKDSEIYFTQTSIRLDIFNSKYLEFCTSQGVKSRILDQEADTLDDFGLKIEVKDNSESNAYTNIRWKSFFEKVKADDTSKDDEADAGASGDQKKFNSIVQFLESECTSSQFSSDYILVADLDYRYSVYCKENNIDDLQRSNIVG